MLFFLHFIMNKKGMFKPVTYAGVWYEVYQG